MSRSRISIIAASLLAASPLVAQGQINYDFNCGYPVPVLNDCTNHFFAEVDYLLFYANQEGLSVASRQDAFFIPDSDATELHNKDLYFENKWDSGVRAVLGFKPACRAWDTRVSYSYFQTRLSPNYNTLVADIPFGEPGSGSTYILNFTPNAFLLSPDGDVTTTLDTSWRLTFNQIDWDFSREVSISEDVFFRPFIGLRGLFTTQRLNTNSILQGITGGEQPINIENIFRMQTQFGGVGIKAGFDLCYDLFCGLELYGDFAGSILWGNFKTVQHLDILTPFEFGTSNSFTHNHHDSILNFDLGIGLKWNYWLNNCSNLLSFKFGWEQHFYSNMNQFQNFLITNAFPTGINLPWDKNIQRGNLSLSGFIFGVSYSF